MENMDNKEKAVRMADKNTCDCKHHSIVPIVVIIFAAIFLLESLGIISESFVDVLWPLLVGVVGVTMLREKGCGCC